MFNLPMLDDDPNSPFPPVSEAQTAVDGLLAWGGDLEPARLLNAYKLGIFPWYSPGQPILWWWPDPRTVIFPAEFHISKRLRRVLRSQRFQISADQNFSGVIDACSRPDQPPDATWIDAPMNRAYCQMNSLGHAHSVEVWEDCELVGGIYGIVIGGMFFGESMFSKATDASKVALAHLCKVLTDQKFTLLDCQLPNDHLYTLGARDLSGHAFSALLRSATKQEALIEDWPATFAQDFSW